MQIDILKLHPDAIVPTYGTDGAACFDLYSVEDVNNVFGRAVVDTGLAFQVPDEHALFIKPRSGLAFRQACHAFAGTIDADFRGSVKVLLVHERNSTITVKKGDRIAQAMILPVPRVTFRVMEQLSITERGAGGYGSTGS